MICVVIAIVNPESGPGIGWTSPLRAIVISDKLNVATELLLCHFSHDLFHCNETGTNNWFEPLVITLLVYCKRLTNIFSLTYLKRLLSFRRHLKAPKIENSSTKAMI